MRIAFTTLGCPEWDIERIIAAARQWGYHGVDFRFYLGHKDPFGLPEFSSQAKQTARRLAGAGLEVCGFSSGAKLFVADPAKRAEQLAEVARYGQLCRAFSTPFIRVFGGRLEGTPREQAVEIAAESLEQMALAAAPAAVMVETHDDFVDSGLLGQVVRKAQAPNVGVLWDLHHPYRLNKESPAQTYRNIGDLTRYTHVKDSRPTGDGKYQYTLGGQGDVPIGEIIHLLKAGGYDGYLVLEWEKKWHPDLPGPEVAFPAYAEYLNQFI